MNKSAWRVSNTKRATLCSSKITCLLDSVLRPIHTISLPVNLDLLTVSVKLYFSTPIVHMDTNIDIDIQLFKLHGLQNNPALKCNKLRCTSPPITKLS